ncbi:GIY-YIG nuclease family protein [Lagierella sp.]|uniref:GIY-YIG nuclease family protein n=1 Tax=Lagierella sp. TaxID=2849657 RepID=UPI00261E937B|nr:GIY-YIG nuclease family protein [Lagierella sp.]
MNFVYILKCNDDSLYTGWTNDLKRRVQVHNSGKGAKYTRGRTPVKLVYYEEYEDKLLAQKREREIKKLTRESKIELILKHSNVKF